MATASPYDSHRFLGIRADGICLWRRRNGPPIETPSALGPRAHIKRQQIGGCDKVESSLSPEALQAFRANWLTNKAFTNHSRARLVASLIFGEGFDG